ncbi:MAG TPA: hypothetical protein VJ783_25875, partial [Pirellulales bacterium]|nr:hypothetical protein [Pirellulales bacterium]
TANLLSYQENHFQQDARGKQCWAGDAGFTRGGRIFLQRLAKLVQSGGRLWVTTGPPGTCPACAGCFFLNCGTDEK